MSELKCGECGKAFARSDSLSRHMQKVHSVGQLPSDCLTNRPTLPKWWLNPEKASPDSMWKWLASLKDTREDSVLFDQLMDRLFEHEENPANDSMLTFIIRTVAADYGDANADQHMDCTLEKCAHDPEVPYVQLNPLYVEPVAWWVSEAWSFNKDFNAGGWADSGGRLEAEFKRKYPYLYPELKDWWRKALDRELGIKAHGKTQDKPGSDWTQGFLPANSPVG